MTAHVKKWTEMTVEDIEVRRDCDYQSGGDLAWRYMQAWRDVDFLLTALSSQPEPAEAELVALVREGLAAARGAGEKKPVDTDSFVAGAAAIWSKLRPERAGNQPTESRFVNDIPTPGRTAAPAERDAGRAESKGDSSALSPERAISDGPSTDN